MSSRRAHKALDLSWRELADADDFLTHNIVDNTFYWVTSRKVYSTLSKELEIEPRIIRTLLKRYMIDSLQPYTPKCVGLIMEHQMTKKFLQRYKGDPVKIRGFKTLCRRYVESFTPDCGYEISATDRFGRFHGLEGCVVARKAIEAGVDIKYLTGSIALLGEKDENELKTELSIITISSVGGSCLMLGPCRFVNHNCDPNAKISNSHSGIKIISLKRILPGEEITVYYSSDFFGRNNRNCLCATCERLGRGFYDPERAVTTEAPIVDVSDSEDESQAVNKTGPIILDTEIDRDDDDDDDDDNSDSGSNSQTPEDFNMDDYSDQDPILDPRRVAKVPRLSAESQRLGRDNYLDSLKMSLVMDSVTPKERGKVVGGRHLRRRCQYRAVGAADLTMLDIYPADNSLDSLVLSSLPAEKNVIDRRQKLRVLHKLYMASLYSESADYSTIYDCLNCGVYFQIDKKYRYKEYCQRCARHENLFGLAWPETTVTESSSSLYLDEKLDRASIQDLIDAHANSKRTDNRKLVRSTSNTPEVPRSVTSNKDIFDEFTSSDESDNDAGVNSSDEESSDGAPYLPSTLEERNKSKSIRTSVTAKSRALKLITLKHSTQQTPSSKTTNHKLMTSLRETPRGTLPQRPTPQKTISNQNHHIRTTPKDTTVKRTVPQSSRSPAIPTLKKRKISTSTPTSKEASIPRTAIRNRPTHRANTNSLAKFLSDDNIMSNDPSNPLDLSDSSEDGASDNDDSTDEEVQDTDWEEQLQVIQNVRDQVKMVESVMSKFSAATNHSTISDTTNEDEDSEEQEIEQKENKKEKQKQKESEKNEKNEKTEKKVVNKVTPGDSVSLRGNDGEQVQKPRETERQDNSTKVLFKSKGPIVKKYVVPATPRTNPTVMTKVLSTIPDRPSYSNMPSSPDYYKASITPASSSISPLKGHVATSRKASTPSSDMKRPIPATASPSSKVNTEKRLKGQSAPMTNMKIASPLPEMALRNVVPKDSIEGVKGNISLTKDSVVSKPVLSIVGEVRSVKTSIEESTQTEETVKEVNVSSSKTKPTTTTTLTKKASPKEPRISTTTATTTITTRTTPNKVNSLILKKKKKKNHRLTDSRMPYNQPVLPFVPVTPRDPLYSTTKRIQEVIDLTGDNEVNNADKPIYIDSEDDEQVTVELD